MKRNVLDAVKVVLLVAYLAMKLFESTHAAEPVRFDVNDVSILWPAPRTPADVAGLISVDEKTNDGSAIWPAAVFDRVVTTAETVKMTDARGSEFRISFDRFTADFKKPTTWKIAAIRIDPSAPGTDPAVQAQSPLGVKPQIRLIVQPVTTSSITMPARTTTIGGATPNAGVTTTIARVHDTAAHLVFDFDLSTNPGNRNSSFEPVVADLLAIKSDLKKLGVDTTGSLGVHPGFRRPEFRAKIRDFLKRHLKESRLNSVAFMGIHRSEPWIFFAMAKKGDEFARVGHPSLGTAQSQMLSFGPASDPILPKPVNGTFRHFGLGLSTASLFGPAVNLDALLFPNAADDKLKQLKVRDIPDIIANPRIAHFFSTDCISCHTESTQRAIRNIDAEAGLLRFARPAGISGPKQELVPRQSWNVRNFGWFPSSGTPETVTFRTANEAAESADFINRVYLADASTLPVRPSPAPPIVVDDRTQAVAKPLTLVMPIKSKQDADQLRTLLTDMQKVPARNPVVIGMDKLGIVHDARFVFLGDEHLAVITTYDGDFDRYIDLFVQELGDVFNALLKHVKDAPTVDVRANPEAFLAYVKKMDRSVFGTLYSGYPNLSVQDIRTLDRRAREANGLKP